MVDMDDVVSDLEIDEHVEMLRYALPSPFGNEDITQYVIANHMMHLSGLLIGVALQTPYRSRHILYGDISGYGVVCNEIREGFLIPCVDAYFGSWVLQCLLKVMQRADSGILESQVDAFACLDIGEHDCLQNRGYLLLVGKEIASDDEIQGEPEDRLIFLKPFTHR